MKPPLPTSGRARGETLKCLAHERLYNNAPYAFANVFDHCFQTISDSPWGTTADRVITSATVLTPLALVTVERLSDGALTLLVRESGRFGSFDAWNGRTRETE